ncbi:hypothetical protein [Streptomyces sp. NPDC127033]|uniref:hypothetical protein n=1 Tax=Streptomyces sp. NPDC127033 TaxID=3347110 RepID=UPI00365EBA0C
MIKILAEISQLLRTGIHTTLSSRWFPASPRKRIGVLGTCAGGGYAVHTAGNMEDATAAGLTGIDTTRAITYYRTERGGNEHSTNRRHSRGDSLLLGYDAFHLVDQLLTRPLQVVLAGHIGNTCSYEAGMQLSKPAPNRRRGTAHQLLRQQPVAIHTGGFRADFLSRHDCAPR